jgi:hypothetical protein
MTTPEKKKLGRPKGPAKTHLRANILVEAKERLEALAAARGLPVSSIIEELVLGSAKKRRTSAKQSTGPD